MLEPISVKQGEISYKSIDISGIGVNSEPNKISVFSKISDFSEDILNQKILNKEIISEDNSKEYSNVCQIRIDGIDGRGLKTESIEK